MTDLNEAVVEVLRLDAEATQGPWRWSPPKGRSCGAFIGVCSFGDEGGGWDMQTTGNPPEDIDAELIGYYRTAAPALAREVQRLQAEVERLKAEIQPRIERSIAFQEAMEEAEAERDAALAEVQRLQELRQRGCDCSDEDACRFARERDEARAEVERLKAKVERLRDAAHRAGQEAMRERCAALCDDWEEATYRAGWREMEIGAQHCAEAIRALEV